MPTQTTASAFTRRLLLSTFAAGLAVTAGIGGLIAGSTAAEAQTPIRFTLDWRFEGPSAPFLAAIEKGYFAEEGLEVTIDSGAGSLESIPRVATGPYDMGFGDINSLIRFRDQNPEVGVKAVMMVYNRPAFAIVGRISRGVSEPKDLEGRVLGAPPPDGAWAQFPIFAVENDLDVSAITIEPVGFPTREPMLAEGQVAAVTGFSFTSFLNTIRLGVPEDDMTVLLMADYGVDLYGNAIIVNTDFAAANPEAVTGFLAAVVAGLRDAAADPAGGVAAIASRNPAQDNELEERRLVLALESNILTDWVMANGVGGIDPERFANSLEQIKLTYEFNTEPDPARFFTDAFLPPVEARMMD